MAGLVPAIHALLWRQGVDARDKRGHDGGDCGKCSSFQPQRISNKRAGLAAGPLLRVFVKILLRGVGDFLGLAAVMRALGDTGRLAAQAAQVIELGAPHLAAADELDRIDHRREQREHALDALAVGNLADREALVQAMAGAADADALVGLDAGALAFDHLDVDDHGVARLEVRNGLARGELVSLLLVERLNEVHGKFSVGCAPARLRERAEFLGRASFYDKAAALSPHPGFTVIWGFW